MTTHQAIEFNIGNLKSIRDICLKDSPFAKYLINAAINDMEQAMLEDKRREEEGREEEIRRRFAKSVQADDKEIFG